MKIQNKIGTAAYPQPGIGRKNKEGEQKSKDA
jgi:hypothetical protein